MLEREVVSKLKSGRSLALIMPLIIGIVVGISPSMAFSQQQKKNRTVGDILKTIEKQARESQIQKEKSALPEAAAQQKSAPKTYKITAPKSSKFYYEQGSDEGALEQATDDAIKQTVRVIKRLGRSPKRGELWLRLAELYVDKARLIDFRIQNKYDEQLKLYQEGKVKSRPKLVLDEANKYNIEAIKLYELFLKDFPKDDKVPQALYFLGYNYFELGDVAKGEVFYQRLTKEYPKSTYVTESNFTLGEYYFEKENYKEAHKYYVRVVKDKSHRLYSFGWYKLAWSLFKLGEHSKAIAGLRQVIFIGRKNKGQSESDGRVPQIKLASEAIKDLVLFYGESGKYKTARSDFKKIVGTKNLDRMIERLGYYYVDTGNRDGARYLFKQLIESDPNAEKAFDYQYQIVNLYSSAGSSKVLRSELYGWIQGYGPGSLWAKSNAQNPELVTKSHALIETTLRNYVLRQHQAAQNSRSKFSQQQAKAGYQLYFNTFKQTEKSDEMHFFFGELLFDVGDYERAAYHYLWVSDNAPNSKYMEQASLNALLALEKNLPQPAEIRKIVGKSIKPVPFDRTINAFIKAAGKYTKSYGESDNYVAIRYKVGSLYYYYNHFDEALEIFWDLVEKHSSTKYSQFAANNILDIYNLKKDYVGLEKAAERLLGVQNIAKSDVGSQIKDVKLKTAFKQARQLEEGKDYAGSAKAYENFALKNPMSELAVSASYNSAVNYERAGNLAKALGMYAIVLRSNDKKNEGLKKDSLKFSALAYEKTGQYLSAAEAYEKYAAQNPKDSQTPDFYFSAAVIREGVFQYSSALSSYQKYLDKSGRKDRWEALYLMAGIWEKRGKLSKAAELYEKYIMSPSQNFAGIVEAIHKVASLNEKMGRTSKANEWYTKTIRVQKRFKARGNDVGVRFAADAQFKLIYKTYEELRAIKLPSPKSLKDQRQVLAFNKKLQKIEQLQKELKTVVSYDDADTIVAALTLQGQAFHDLSAALANADLPPGLNNDQKKMIRDGLNEQAKKNAELAFGFYENALTKSYSLHAYNIWTKTARLGANQLDKTKYIDYGFEIFSSQQVDTLGL